MNHWTDIVGEEWAKVLTPGFLDSKYTLSVLKEVNKQYETKIIFPDKNCLFKPFRLCPYSNFRVLILGTDPHPSRKATGLAFANPDDSGFLSTDLEAIRICLDDQIYQNVYWQFDQTLYEWARQGILLLNINMTIEMGHVKNVMPSVWSAFSANLLTQIAKQKEKDATPLVVCLWGYDAQSYKKYLTINPKIKILEATIPIKNWECTHFTEINDFLDEQGYDTIDW